jgi:hypothetical protein
MAEINQFSVMDKGSIPEFDVSTDESHHICPFFQIQVGIFYIGQAGK